MKLTWHRHGGAARPGKFVLSSAWDGGFAVRRDWPDGTHDFFGLSRDLERVLRRKARDERLWRRGPIRPVSWMVVYVDRVTFEEHPPWCRKLWCVGGLVVLAGQDLQW
ncbi:hypothetical protein [Dactylosporangium sp. CA-092794]|uniref:hypothetical protein n=1 Tax=Dactylosporangium sp. CA-092794 TaxID=3239929 RepID=UPI003D9250CD